MRDRTLYLIWFKQTHSANSCDFGDGQPVMVQDKVWWAHIHLGSTIKTRFDQDKIKDCKGQTNWRPTGGAYLFPVGLFGDLGKYLCFHHIIIGLISIPNWLRWSRGMVVTQIQHKRSAGLSPPPTQCPQFPNQPDFWRTGWSNTKTWFQIPPKESGLILQPHNDFHIGDH